MPFVYRFIKPRLVREVQFHRYAASKQPTCVDALLNRGENIPAVRSIGNCLWKNAIKRSRRNLGFIITKTKKNCCQSIKNATMCQLIIRPTVSQHQVLHRGDAILQHVCRDFAITPIVAASQVTGETGKGIMRETSLEWST